MYYETKVALRRAFRISKLLFRLGKDEYNRLIGCVESIEFPTESEIGDCMCEGQDTEDAIIALLKTKYAEEALRCGFTREQGIALLEYTAMLKEIEE